MKKHSHSPQTGVSGALWIRGEYFSNDRYVVTTLLLDYQGGSKTYYPYASFREVRVHDEHAIDEPAPMTTISLVLLDMVIANS